MRYKDSNKFLQWKEDSNILYCGYDVCNLHNTYLSRVNRAALIKYSCGHIVETYFCGETPKGLKQDLTSSRISICRNCREQAERRKEKLLKLFCIKQMDKHSIIFENFDQQNEYGSIIYRYGIDGIYIVPITQEERLMRIIEHGKQDIIERRHKKLFIIAENFDKSYIWRHLKDKNLLQNIRKVTFYNKDEIHGKDVILLKRKCGHFALSYVYRENASGKVRVDLIKWDKTFDCELCRYKTSYDFNIREIFNLEFNGGYKFNKSEEDEWESNFVLKNINFTIKKYEAARNRNLIN